MEMVDEAWLAEMTRQKAVWQELTHRAFEVFMRKPCIFDPPCSWCQRLSNSEKKGGA